jgi:hypothetical protein
VIMLLGVDRADNLRVEPLVGQRLAAAVVALGILGLSVAALASTEFEATGVTGELDSSVPDVVRLGESIFTDYLFAFEITSILLVIAVVGAVLLARPTRREDEIVDPGQDQRAEEVAERMATAEARAEGVRPDGHELAGEGEPEPAETQPTAEEVTQ